MRLILKIKDMNGLDKYYKILGLNRQATLNEVKQAYRKLVKQWHPDRFVNNPNSQESLIATEKFQEIHEAYTFIKSGKVDQKSTKTSSSPEIKVERKDADFYYNLGVIAIQIRDWKDAMEYFSLAIKLNPEYWQAYLSRSMVLEKQGFKNRAESDWRKGKELQLKQNRSNRRTSTQNTQKTPWDCQIKARGHLTGINSIDITSDGRIAVTGSSDYTVGIWNLVKYSLIGKLKGHTDVIHSVAISRNGSILATASADKTIKIWDLKKRKLNCTIGGWFSGHKDEVLSLCFTRNSQYLISGSMDKTVRCWDLNTEKEVYKYGLYRGGVLDVNCNLQGSLIATAGLDRWIRILNSKTNKLSKSIQTNAVVTTVAFSPSANILASGGFDRKIRLWNLNQKGSIKTPIKVLADHAKTISKIVFSSDGNQLISGSDDGSVKIWNVSNGELIWTLKPNIGEIKAVAISKNGKTILAGGTKSDLIICEYK